jgi:uncharacterized protein
MEDEQLKAGFKVIDCNRHVIEPIDLWDRWLDEPYKSQQVVQVDNNRGTVSVSGRAVFTPPRNVFDDVDYRNVFARASAQCFSPESNLADMDVQGIDTALLLPTLGMYVPWADFIDPPLAAALCAAYNNWLHSYCSVQSSRLEGVALLPLQDPAGAVRELERAVEELGFVAAFMRTNPLVGRRLHDDVYDPLYARAESLGVPLVISGPTGTVLPEVGSDRFESTFYREAFAPPVEMWLATLSFLGGTVCERFPDLRVAFVGAGCGWLPYWIERADEHWGNPFGKDAPCSYAPSKLFERGVVVAADPWETTLPEVLEETPRNVVWGSEYPLPQVMNAFPSELDAVTANTLLSDAQKEDFLCQNAARFFKIA